MIRFATYILVFFLGFEAMAQPSDKTRLLPTENDYYKIVTLPLPEGLVLEVGGLAALPNGSIAASTRRGEVWIIENPYMRDGQYPNYKRFASGLHEILGLAYKDGSLIMAQRGELTKLTDADGDGRADMFETIYAWPLSGHYHEYSFGPIVAPDGSMFVTGNVAFGDIEWWRGESRVPWRGWTMHIWPDGKMEPFATGMRSPCGIGIVDGEFFYGDNQGDWMGSGGIVHVQKGDFTGHPAGLRWADRPESPVKVRTEDIYSRVDPKFAAPGQAPIKPENNEKETPKPLFEVAREVPGIKTPAVWLPHGILGISTSEIVTDNTAGQFGPFAGQLLVGDQGQSKILRVFLEKVQDTYQGAAFAFREGFQSGVLRMTWGHDGSLFVGQTNRGWGSTGSSPYGLQRLVWSGKTPFEMKAIRAMPDGFEIEFTQPVDKASANNPASYEVTGFTYKYHPVYGSPVANQQNCAIKGILVSEDGLRARLVVEGLRAKYIHEIKATGVKSYAGDLPLLHAVGYYTLNVIPEGEKLKLPATKTAMGAMDHSHHGAAPAAKTPAPAQKPATTTAKTASSKRVTKMPASWEKADKSITLSTLPGLKYDQTLITVKAGSKVKLTFYNNDDMPHNMVIVAPGAADIVGKAAMDLGLKGPDVDYVPASSKVLHHTKLMPPGSTETIYFVAPGTAGDYMYVCTFPGHYQLMRGVLRVQ